jgi:TRAP transporter TAXI family solute receptor
MKKLIALFCAIAVAVALLAARQSAERRDDRTRGLRIATGGESGVYHAYGDALASALRRRLKVSVTVIPSGGSVDNINLLRNDRADIAFVQNDIMTYAYDGTNIFSTAEPFKGFSAIAGLYPETCQIIARRDIDGISDLRGRRVSVGHEGSGTELNAKQILDAYGMSYADIDVDHLSFGASVAAFRDGRVDAFFCTAGVPTPAIVELAASGEARILSVGDAHARSLISQYPYYSQQTIPKGAYPGIGEEAETVAVKAALVANNKLDGKVVAEIIKIIFEDGETAGVSPGGRPSRKSAADGLPIPMHTDAQRLLLGK